MRFLRAGLCAMALMSLSVSAAHAQKFGIMGGGNWEALADLDPSLESTFQVSSGIHFGVFADIGTPIVSVRPGLLYSNSQSLVASLQTLSAGSYRISNLSMPIDVKLNAIPVLYIFAGPEFNLNLSNGAPPELDAAFNNFTVHGDAGLGLDFGPVFLEARYIFGLSSITKSEYTIGGTTFTGADQVSNAVRASIGVALF